MKCPKCGFELRETDKFCSECGTSLKKERQENKSKNYTYKKYACIISFIILLVLILGFGLRSCVLNFVDDNSAKTFGSSEEDEYRLYQLNELRFPVPYYWEMIRTGSGFEFSGFDFSPDYESLKVDCRVYNRDIGLLQVKDYINEFEKENDYIFIDEEYAYIDGDIVFKRDYTVPDSILTVSTYTFDYADTIFCFVFKTWVSDDDTESYIIDNSHIIRDSLAGDTTVPEYTYYTDKNGEKISLTEPITSEPPTEKTTEPITEKPTEATIRNDTSTDGFWAEGSGDYVATGLNVTRYGVLHIEYSGEGHFSVISYEGDDYDELLVNTTDSYSGDVLIDHSGSFSLEISASEGSWSISSSGLSIDDSTSFSGRGDSVTGLTSHDGGIWGITHNGSRHFSVIEYGYSEGYMDLLVNETGSYNGTVKAESGDNIFFKVSADGEWSIKKK